MRSVSTTFPECRNAPLVNLWRKDSVVLLAEPMVVRIEYLLKDIDAPNAVRTPNFNDERCLQDWTCNVHLRKSAVGRRG